MARDRLAFTARSCLQASRTELGSRSRAQWQSRRPYSIQSQEEAIAQLPGIDPSALSIARTTTPKQLVPPEELVFGRTFTGKPPPSTPLDSITENTKTACTDHMLSIEWTASQGWLPPRITPYQNLSLDPATCVFHYAFECFEGMKAYKNPQGQIRLFRPDKNMARMNKSASRIALPTIEPRALISLISKFVALEERFIPTYTAFLPSIRPPC